ncbi:BQ2448_4774 [Microbotryum intermedium]|uniref:Transcription initiation factor TFIID subunit 13 n=1 Tax=Microbotryum intermedium TaxID=269621 RepID=A0A238FE31_9BASI|nr:BQ2448_4774 [Microbotryum intermedium]
MSDPASSSHRASTSSNQHPSTAATTATTTTSQPSTSRAQKYRPFRARGLFVKDLGPMLFGFGDQAPCLPETALLMEELLINHITTICQSAQRSALDRDRLKLDDVKFSLRHDPKKLARVEELLFMTEVIARARGRDDLEQYADEPIGGTKGKVEQEKDKDKDVPNVGGGRAPVAVALPALSKASGTTRPRDREGSSKADGTDRDAEGESPKKKKKKKNKADKGKEKDSVSTPMVTDD